MPRRDPAESQALGRWRGEGEGPCGLRIVQRARRRRPAAALQGLTEPRGADTASEWGGFTRPPSFFDVRFMQQLVSVNGAGGDASSIDPQAADVGSPQDRMWMALAMAQAAEAARAGEVPVGAVVIKDGVVIAQAGNRRERDQDPCGHAELIAIRAAAGVLGTWRLDGCEVVVTLEPCAMCAGAMVLARIQRCVFGCADPKGGYLGSLGDLSSSAVLNHRFRVTPGVERELCAAQLRSFFRDLRAAKRRAAARPPLGEGDAPPR